MKKTITDTQFEDYQIFFEIDHHNELIIDTRKLYEFALLNGMVYSSRAVSKDPTDDVDGVFSFQEFEDNYEGIDYSEIALEYIIKNNIQL